MMTLDWLSVALLLFYLSGVVFAADAIWQGRTAQGTIAWTLTLIFMPFIGIPLYALFGTRKFHGYRLARRHGDEKLNALGQQIRHSLQPFSVNADAVTRPLYHFFRLPMTHSNHCELLINGKHTFTQMHRAIAAARHSVCVQFYIVRDDATGQAMADLLIERAQSGIRVYFLYDEIGSHQLGQRFIQRLKQGGVRVSRFNSWQFRHRLQINFRNHRKLLLVDGEQAFVGGLNLGDEYQQAGWRDTHLRVSGPAALPFQLSFCEDWYWATQYLPQLQWQPQANTQLDAQRDTQVMCINSGPADVRESASLSFTHLIHQAQQRIWIATPYFIPDVATTAALRLAAARGLDVRVIIPQRTDKWFVQHAMQSYVDELRKSGIHFYQHQADFMHQKVMLIDQQWSCIGSANFDNRSLRINFEANALVKSEDFARQTEQMLQQDFKHSQPVKIETRIGQRLLNKVLRLTAPLL
ncbi:cardiolipin synthase [Bacterioplanoides sp.]|uniref:cardiolipin synthase n=1 Tax=Bacterioplanoides sp. TaxID=2066072 RepID=UPI003B00EA19